MHLHYEGEPQVLVFITLCALVLNTQQSNFEQKNKLILKKNGQSKRVPLNHTCACSVGSNFQILVLQ